MTYLLGPTAVLLLLSTALDAQSPTPGQRPRKKDVPLECRILLAWKTAPVGGSIPAEVELKNTSDQTIRIRYGAHVLEHLDFVIRGPDGKALPKIAPYGAIFSPYGSTTTLSLKPSETYTHTVDIFRIVDAKNRKMPGVYRITAVYETDGIRAVSPEVQVTFREAKK